MAKAAIPRDDNRIAFVLDRIGFVWFAQEREAGLDQAFVNDHQQWRECHRKGDHNDKQGRQLRGHRPFRAGELEQYEGKFTALREHERIEQSLTGGHSENPTKSHQHNKFDRDENCDETDNKTRLIE